jgi:hypothetical protein
MLSLSLSLFILCLATPCYPCLHFTCIIHKSDCVPSLHPSISFSQSIPALYSQPAKGSKMPIEHQNKKQPPSPSNEFSHSICGDSSCPSQVTLKSYTQLLQLLRGAVAFTSLSGSDILLKLVHAQIRHREESPDVEAERFSPRIGKRTRRSSHCAKPVNAGYCHSVRCPQKPNGFQIRRL